jgi:sugar lactone lactonase YvrE
MLTSLFNFISRTAVVVLVAMVSVNYMPDSLFTDFPVEPKSVQPNDFDSVIPQDWNTKLSDGQPEFIQLNNILGPESIAISKNGLMYTGLADGRLVELDPKNKYKVRTVLRFSGSQSKCPDNVATKADECGRFLQLRFLNDTLYALEAQNGLYKVDTRTGTKTLLGPKPLYKTNLYNGFVFDPKDPNIVYLTLSSNRWDALNIMWSIIEQESSGQLVVVDLNSGKRATAFSNLRMPNGLDVDTKRDQLLFSETLQSSLSSVALEDLRNAFKAAKDGDQLKGLEKKLIIPLFPGFPDNVVVEDDRVYVALPFVKLNGKELFDHLNTMPQVRKAVSRFLFGLGKLLEYVHNNFYQHPLLESAYRELKCGHVIYRAIKTDKSAVVEYNLSTGASRLFGSNTFGFVSEALPDGNGNLLIGSFRSPFIVKQKISANN